jgi:Zn-dependent protease
MFPSLKLGRLFGIPLVIHWTFWLLPLWAVFSHAQEVPLAFRLVVLFALFGCVILHELGHALAARFYGIATRDITLYPIGGVASMERISEKPIEELVVAVAGPAVNIALAAGLGLFLALGAALASGFAQTPLAALLGTLLVGNLILAAFNMIPAFPLDGGRVLRALLSMFLGHLQGTRVAVYVGGVLTMVLMALLLIRWPEFVSPFLIVIAFFVFTAGQRELLMLEVRERTRRMHDAYVVPPVVAVAEPPQWARPAVTVHVWDPETQRWVRQEQE